MDKATLWKEKLRVRVRVIKLPRESNGMGLFLLATSAGAEISNPPDSVVNGIKIEDNTSLSLA